MDSGKEKLEELQKIRYKILRALYDTVMLSDKDQKQVAFSPKNISSSLQIPGEKVINALNYLEGEGLVQLKLGASFDNKMESHYYLQHKGIVEIEKSIESPDAPTEHFMMSVVQNFNAPVGSVQNAPHSTANVTQNNAANINDVIALIKELKEIISKELPQEHQEDAVDDLLLLEEEIQAPEPRKPRIKRTLKRLQNLASNVSSTTRFLAAVAKITTKLQELGLLPDYPPA